MISHLYPSAARLNPNSGTFIRTQLVEYRKHVDIFLSIPIDISPPLGFLKNSFSARHCIDVLSEHFSRTLLRPLPDINTPVPGRFARFISLHPRPLFPWSGGFMLFIRLLPRATRLFRSHGIDIFHGQTTLPDGLAAVLLGAFFNRPSIVTVRGSDIHSIGTNPLTVATAKLVLHSATRITSVSSDLKLRVVTDLGVPADNVTVIPNGVDAAFAKITHYNDLRAELGIDADSPVFLFVGKLSDIKDPFTLLSAFNELLINIPSAHLIIVGGGDLDSEVRSFVDSLGLRRSVHTIGHVPHNKVPSYMKSCDALCLPSLKEGWPNVLLEAMSFGKPVIATNVGGIPEAVCSDEFGYLVPPRNPSAFANAMMNALNKRWDHRKIREHALNNSWGNVAERYYRLYQSVSQKLPFSFTENISL